MLSVKQRRVTAMIIASTSLGVLGLVLVTILMLLKSAVFSRTNSTENVRAIRTQVFVELEAEQVKLSRDIAGLAECGLFPLDWCYERRLLEAWPESEVDLLASLAALRRGDLVGEHEVGALAATWRAQYAGLSEEEAENHFDPGDEKIPMCMFESYVVESSFLTELEIAIDFDVARCAAYSPFGENPGNATVNKRRLLAADLLACRVELLAEKGHVDDAVDTALRLCRLVEPEKMLYDPLFLVSKSWRAADRSLGAIIMKGGLDAATRQRFLVHYEKRGDMNWVKRRLFVKAIQEGDGSRKPASSHTKDDSPELASALETALQFADMLQSPLYESREAFDKMLAAQLDALSRDRDVMVLATLVLGGADPVRLAWRNLSVFSEGLLLQRDSSMRDIVAVAFAIDDYCHSYGRYPETLSALVPKFVTAVPLDPICGEPPDYTYMEEGGYVLSTEELPCMMTRDGVFNIVSEHQEPQAITPARGLTIKPYILWDTRNRTPLVTRDCYCDRP
ncbi:MAG TPA: hypothetical protein PKY01_19415 [Candidatus Hydrogenedentes bacterium]|nr:hypothetical protein [Candidatus Hydrogenedentota bacterium]